MGTSGKAFKFLKAKQAQHFKEHGVFADVDTKISEWMEEYRLEQNSISALTNAMSQHQKNLEVQKADAREFWKAILLQKISSGSNDEWVLNYAEKMTNGYIVSVYDGAFKFGPKEVPEEDEDYGAMDYEAVPYAEPDGGEDEEDDVWNPEDPTEPRPGGRGSEWNGITDRIDRPRGEWDGESDITMFHRRGGDDETAYYG